MLSDIIFCNHNFFGCNSSPPSQWARAFSFTRFLDHTQRRSTVGRTPLDEWSARRRYLYLTTHNTHNRQKSMPPGGIRSHSLSKRAAADLRLRPHVHWDWPSINLLTSIWIQRNTGIFYCLIWYQSLPSHSSLSDCQTVPQYTVSGWGTAI